MTLRQLVTAHPDWLDHEMAVYTSDGTLDFIGAAGMVYEGDELTMTSDTDPTPTVVKVLVFAAN